MINIKMENIGPENFTDNMIILNSGMTTSLFHNQVTEVQLQTPITVPKGYIGIAIPTPDLQYQSSVLIEGNGHILSETISTLLMRKGTSGSVKIRSGMSLAFLVFQKIETINIKG